MSSDKKKQRMIIEVWTHPRRLLGDEVELDRKQWMDFQACKGDDVGVVKESKTAERLRQRRYAGQRKTTIKP